MKYVFRAFALPLVITAVAMNLVASLIAFPAIVLWTAGEEAKNAKRS